MRIIAIEEHFLDLDIARASRPEAERLSPAFAAAYGAGQGYNYSPAPEVLLDLEEGRVADMDAHGISMQVLSSLSTQQLPADVAVELVRKVNDRAAAAVAARPDRFAAFAALPTTVPEAAADELDRAVGELGFVGSMINGRTGDAFLDAPRFDAVLRRSAELRVPVYLHPGVPPVETSRSNYEGGLDPIVTARLQTSAWGWHVETGIHFLHLVLAGVFDRYPDLQVILGHWGEMVPFFLERIEEALPQQITHLDRPVGAYFRENAHITPSGMFSQAQLQFCVETVGIERIMFSVDYPFLGNDGAEAFLRQANLPPLATEKIAHLNAERLLALPS
ncbi:amidohydrolase family protein [Streptomyces violaceusniger]|uniref:Amidohydrolase 2 n=1 Tax=Streptomyces violaceusniger (strain Tu 4113) TaxID=653045 RepID=G2P515_STRV4|nr:amidohydrolase family protein [Streptomyces violaceusniger]AEM84192.1 amidohydrolase 2 [Streptomyces violaceusniger Tu 4113]